MLAGRSLSELYQSFRRNSNVILRYVRQGGKRMRILATGLGAENGAVADHDRNLIRHRRLGVARGGDIRCAVHDWSDAIRQGGTIYTYTGKDYTTCGGTYCNGGPYALAVTFGTTLAGNALYNLPVTNINA